MEAPSKYSAGDSQAGVAGRRSGAVWLPLGMLASLVVGLVLLDRLAPHGWFGMLQVSAGCSLCLVAGWTASTLWSRSYWNRSMARQVAVWRRITDAFFTWVEDIQVSTEALNQLKVSLEEAVPGETA